MSRSFLLLLGLLLGPMVGATAEERTYSVAIDDGLAPRMKAEDVAQIAATRLAASVQRLDVDPETGAPALVPPAPKILELRLTTLDKFMEIWNNKTGVVDRRLIWFVRAEGEFVNYRTPPGAPASVHGSGYFVFDDATGELISFGSSEPPIGTEPRPEDAESISTEP